MRQEYSYGAVVYRYENNLLYILIEYMKLGHISLPKGHIEPGETNEECALREIKEETNLDVDLDTSFSHTITYSPVPGTQKEVTFYLATPKNNHIIPQKCEISHIEWVEENKAILLLTHDSDKEVLTSALNVIHQRKK